jgi:hypothetical protein
VKKLWPAVLLVAGLLAGWWIRGYSDSDACLDADGQWEQRGDYCYGARSAQVDENS